MEQVHNGPFGAVVVSQKTVVGECWNEVLRAKDPAAHAEVVAIRNACRRLGTYDLSGCEIYTWCEPFPMCLGAIHWTHIGRIYYSDSRSNAGDIEFRDEFIHGELAKPIEERTAPMLHVPCDEALDVFDAWKRRAGHVTY